MPKADINNHCGSGRLGKTPEIRQTPSGVSVTDLSVCMNVGYGAKQKPVWTRLTVWGKQAEFICQYGKKGDMVVWSGGQYMIEEFNGNNGLIKTHYFELGQSAQLNLLSKAGGSEEKPQERSDADDSGAQSPDSYA